MNSEEELKHLVEKHPADVQGLLRRPLVQPLAFAQCVCEKLVAAEKPNMEKYYSGVVKENAVITPGVNYWAILCPDCRREFNGWPRLVCLGCRRLVGFVKPSVEKCGFAFERGRHYHISDCPQCRPERGATPILEYERFLREQKIPVKLDVDIVQEIEQKRLQGEVAAARLRAEFNLRNANEDQT